MATTQQYCTFTVDGLLVGIEVSRVQEIIRYQVTTPVPLAHPVVRGLINLRGQIVTALDLRQRLELPARHPDTLPTNVVVLTADGVVSFLVDEIGDVVEVDETTFETPPETLRGIARDLILGAHKLDARLLMVLDAERAANLREVA